MRVAPPLQLEESAFACLNPAWPEKGEISDASWASDKKGIPGARGKMSALGTTRQERGSWISVEQRLHGNALDSNPGLDTIAPCGKKMEKAAQRKKFPGEKIRVVKEELARKMFSL